MKYECFLCHRMTSGDEWEQREFTVCWTCVSKRNLTPEDVYELLGRPQNRTLLFLMQTGITVAREYRSRVQKLPETV